jgi:hypothetical protein
VQPTSIFRARYDCAGGVGTVIQASSIPCILTEATGLDGLPFHLSSRRRSTATFRWPPPHDANRSLHSHPDGRGVRRQRESQDPDEATCGPAGVNVTVSLKYNTDAAGDGRRRRCRAVACAPLSFPDGAAAEVKGRVTNLKPSGAERRAAET